MDFLLECIGFPPDHDSAVLARLLRESGESVAWRGPSGDHLRYPLDAGLEVRLDREADQARDTLWPYYASRRRLRVAVNEVQVPPDSPFDALIQGRANPPLPSEPLSLEAIDEAYPLEAYLTDARRIPRDMRSGHVLAVSIAGFALDVTYVGPNDGARAPWILERPAGAWMAPLGGTDAPGGCMEVSLRVRAVRRLQNPITGVGVDLVEMDAPGRPLELFLSRWQLDEEDLPEPRPGWRVEGVFLLQGRVAGGLPPRRRREAVFG
jgi:hypothetical protein